MRILEAPPSVFQNWAKFYLKELRIANGVETINAEQMSKAVNYESLRLPSTIKSIDEKTFKKMETIKKLECSPQLLKYFPNINFTTYIVP